MYQKNNRPVVATDEDYKQGRHYRWEVAAHEAEEEFEKKTGRRWEYEFRKRWISRYFTITPNSTAYEVVPCPVCTDVIAKAMIDGTNPFQPPDSFKEELHFLNRRIGSVIGVRKLPRRQT